MKNFTNLVPLKKLRAGSDSTVPVSPGLLGG